MNMLTDEFIKSLSKEELEETVIKLRNEISYLSDELKFWKCRADEKQISEGRVLMRNEVTEEMLNKLNNIASEIDKLEVEDGRSDKNPMNSSNDLLNKKSSIININVSPPMFNESSASNLLPSLVPLPPPPPTKGTLKSDVQTNSIQKILKSDKLNNVMLKRAPPIMSKAEFMKKHQSRNLFKNSKINDNEMNNKSRASLQWGCSNEDYPLFSNNIDKNVFKDYFSEFNKKVSLLFNEDIDNNSELKIHSNSVFSLVSDEYNTISEDLISIPREKLFEWFIKKDDKIDNNIIACRDNNNIVGSSNEISNSGLSNNYRDNEINTNISSNVNELSDVSNENKTVNGLETGKNDETKVSDKNIQKERKSLFCSKTSKMLQITINYFKKKIPKDLQKSLLEFKKSILKCTLDKEGVNLLLETVPDPIENPSKYDVWKECVNLVENYLKSNSRESLLEEEEFVYFLSRIPNLSKRLECMILRSSFEQLYNESLKWINEKIQGLELILNHKKLPLLFKSIIDSRNILNNKLNEMNNNNDIMSVKYIPLSSIKKLNNLKSPNIKGKTLIHFICSIVGEVFNNNELFILKKSSEKNIYIIYTMVTDLLFSWLDLRDNTNNLMYGTLSGSDEKEVSCDLSDEFDIIMKNFYAEKYDQMVKLSSAFKYLLRLYVASCYYFGDIKTFLPINMKLLHDKQDLIDYLMDFIKKYNSILTQEINRENEETSPKDNIAVENKKKLLNVKESDNKCNSTNDNKLKAIFSNNSGNRSNVKSNIKELFAKSIVKELNLKPLFNKEIQIENDNNYILSKDMNENSDSFNAKMRNSIGNRNFDDIDQTIYLSDALNYSNIYNNNEKIRNSILNNDVNPRNSILELSNEAREILSRSNNNISVNLNSSAEFDNTSNYDTSDNDTVALSSPSYTRLLDINNLTGSNNDPESLITEENNQENTKKKKVMIVADVCSPVKQNGKFNRRQSIKRMCQMASYLDNFEHDSPLSTSNYEENYLNIYKSPTQKNVSFYENYGDTFTVNDDTHTDSENYTKTCILNDVLDINHLNKENSAYDNCKTDINKESCENIELTPEKTISSRRTIRFGATISPHD
ncbi:RNA recognition motif [Cryptosporidium bovis]|uniref:RNA recognition motif n=1 Tax=Cryptosporidium bovis TaxID=310047 RepID=UPI00351A3CD5|nr:RNA recognition motif [Cryptosporidium bovis]